MGLAEADLRITSLGQPTQSPEKVTNERRILDEITEAAKILKQETRGVPLKQAMGNLMVGGLVRLNREAKTSEQRQEAYAKSKEVLTFFQSFFGDEWLLVRSGFLGEACVTMSLEQMGFVVKEPSQEDDMRGKIDLWGDAKDGTIFAPQIKTRADITQIDLFKVEPDKDYLGLPREFYEYVPLAKDMVQYIAATNEFAGKEIIPMFIMLPGGEGNEHAAYNMTTGIPLKETQKRIEDLIFRKIWNNAQ